jgi:hypothetical protein
MVLETMNRGFTVVVDEPFVFDDAQGFIKSFHRVDLDTSDVEKTY